MSVDILYKNMAPHLNELFGDFSGYQLPKMSMHILYNNMVPLINERVVSHILSAPNRGKRNKNTFQSNISTKWVEKCSVTRL